MSNPSVFSLRSLRLSGSIRLLHFQRITPSRPLRRHPNMQAVALTERSAALSGISRASRQSIVLIQRFLPCFSPVISADYMQNLHKNCIFRISVSAI